MKDSKTRWLCQQLNEVLFKHQSCCMRACTLSREERFFARARSQLSEETDIVKFMKKIRQIEFFQQQLQKRLDFKIDVTQAEIRTIERDPDDRQIFVQPISLDTPSESTRTMSLHRKKRMFTFVDPGVDDEVKNVTRSREIGDPFSSNRIVVEATATASISPSISNSQLRTIINLEQSQERHHYQLSSKEKGIDVEHKSALTL